MKNYHTKLDAAVLDCYVQLYKNSEPSVDFEKLMEDAPFNELGQKVIDFNSYEIEEELMNEIVQKTVRVHKLKSWEIMTFRQTIYLGCSPKFKKK